MRVEHDGVYALVGSQGGAPQDPAWVANLRADPTAVRIQDGPELWDTQVREISGAERDLWWQRCVDAFAPYADYQERTPRVIPVYLTSPRS
jgi:deazaflavin-dependent oxidoreductase (nitroreductase family)